MPTRVPIPEEAVSDEAMVSLIKWAYRMATEERA